MFAKNDLLAYLRRDTTLFLSFFVLGGQVGVACKFVLLKAVFRLRYSWMILLCSQGRLGSLVLGIVSSMILMNTV